MSNKNPKRKRVDSNDSSNIDNSKKLDNNFKINNDYLNKLVQERFEEILNEEKNNIQSLKDKVIDLDNYYNDKIKESNEYITYLEDKLDSTDGKNISLLREIEELKNEIELIKSDQFQSKIPIIFRFNTPKNTEVNNIDFPPTHPKKEVLIDTDNESEYESDSDSDYELKKINIKIKSLTDLIHLGNLYDPLKKIKYNINIKRLNKLIGSLTKLNNMIGMDKVKQTVIDLILYFLQNIDDKNNDMLHCVIEGPPGVGKTEVAKIIGEIYKNLGVLSTNKFKCVKRSDLIGGYLGQTAIKTQKVLDECEGGVLFIDEAYSLGNSEGKDSYSKECIDTLTRHLSENKQNFICIIAGYKHSLNECFFKYNEGLERRFPYRFEIDKYSPQELSDIFKKIVKENNWSLKLEDFDINFFEKNIKYFLFNGGDMEILFHKTKIAHSRRIIYLDNNHKKKITMEDINLGMELLLENNEISNRNIEEDKTFISLYT